jgi:hypothetical protein
MPSIPSTTIDLTSLVRTPTHDDLSSKRTRCEVWTRVMGYHRPVSQFNIGKKSEHYSRRHFEEEASLRSARVTT